MAESERPGDVTAPPVIAPPPDARPVQPPPVQPGRAKQSTATTVLIVAAVLVAGFFIIVIGAAFLVPGLLRARMTANETSAMTTLRAISVAQVAYASTCGHDAFAASLPVLAKPSKDGDGPFLDQSLAGTAPQVHGYVVTMAAGAGATAGPADCHGAPTVTAFYATAVPMTWGTTGTRSFAINADGTVWMTTSAAAPSEPFGAPATIVR
jgi:type IV pilus assembly protein PilA